MNTVDKYTFGNTTSAINLADILTKENNPKLLGKVSSVLSRVNRYINLIDCGLEKTDDRKVILQMVKNAIISEIDEKEWPKSVKTHVKLMVTTNYRKAFHGEPDRNDLTRKLQKTRK